MDIKRVAVVTGTAHGMGSAIAESLLKSGHTVHGVDRDQADLSNPEAVKEYFQKIGQSRFEILHHRTGKLPHHFHGRCKKMYLGFSKN